MTTHPHRVQLLSSRFKVHGRRLFFTRARLFLDRIELSGWHLGKRYVEYIPLDRLDDIEWDAEASDAAFHLNEGKTIRVRLPHMDRWKHSLEQRLTWSAPGRFPIASRFTTTAYRELPLPELITFTTSMG